MKFARTFDDRLNQQEPQSPSHEPVDVTDIAERVNEALRLVELSSHGDSLNYPDARERLRAILKGLVAGLKNRQ